MKISLARRAAMKALLGSPIAAKGIVQAAAAEVLGAAVTNSVPVANEPISVGNGPDTDPLWELFRKHQQAKMRRLSRQRGREIEHHMPVNVSSKKSWSPAFKAHVTAEIMREYELWDEYSDDAKVRALVSIGVLPSSLLGDDA
ncbi:hypothetical protein KZZ08_00600 [Roseovarius mucosus]|uniref:hypothetical protein n=1 Tax=Roseovarius mucosus TaxID=215743 RepID=UPI001C5E1473|nr:hypothetical protein [Roseovarius mucosus]MBW4972095.1 hypothetical protein [Roseovarius mucosus]